MRGKDRGAERIGLLPSTIARRARATRGSRRRRRAGGRVRRRRPIGMYLRAGRTVEISRSPAQLTCQRRDSGDEVMKVGQLIVELAEGAEVGSDRLTASEDVIVGVFDVLRAV
jgi:hypothetical protein